jgi:hypothetical protein
MNYAQRGSFQINGTATPNRSLGFSGSDITNEVNNVVRSVYFENSTDFIEPYLTESKVGQSNAGAISFSCEWTFEGSDVLGNSSYTEIVNL